MVYPETVAIFLDYRTASESLISDVQYSNSISKRRGDDVRRDHRRYGGLPAEPWKSQQQQRQSRSHEHGPNPSTNKITHSCCWRLCVTDIGWQNPSDQMNFIRFHFSDPSSQQATTSSIASDRIFFRFIFWCVTTKLNALPICRPLSVDSNISSGFVVALWSFIEQQTYSNNHCVLFFRAGHFSVVSILPRRCCVYRTCLTLAPYWHISLKKKNPA